MLYRMGELVLYASVVLAPHPQGVKNGFWHFGILAFWLGCQIMREKNNITKYPEKINSMDTSVCNLKPHATENFDKPMIAQRSEFLFAHSAAMRIVGLDHLCARHFSYSSPARSSIINCLFFSSCCLPASA